MNSERENEIKIDILTKLVVNKIFHLKTDGNYPYLNSQYDFHVTGIRFREDGEILYDMEILYDGFLKPSLTEILRKGNKIIREHTEKYFGNYKWSLGNIEFTVSDSIPKPQFKY